MVSFKGSEIFTLDPKCRVKFPAKMLKSLSAGMDTFVLTRGLEKCIFAYPLHVWEEKYTPKFEELNQFDSNHRKFLRGMLEWSEEIDLDTQQRLILPKELLDFSGIGDKVKIIGMLDHIEFWSPEEYDLYKSSYSESYEYVVEQVMTSKRSE